MYGAPPAAGERYYLRLLLTRVPGPMSFEDLRTVDGVQLPDFKASCLARGFLEDDGEWRDCLREAGVFLPGRALRSLFTTILIFNNVTHPRALWDEFRLQLCDDLAATLTRPPFNIPNPTDDQVYDYGLLLIRNILLAAGKDPNQYDLPEPVNEWNAQNPNPFLAQHEFLHDERVALQAQAAADELLLNVEQRAAYIAIQTAYRNGTGGTFFIHGPGGTGKTFIYNTLARMARGEGFIVLCVASSGVAALLLLLGSTAHSTFRIPIPVSEFSTLGINKDSPHAALLKNTRLIIWDEAGMIHRHGIEAVDRTLRDFRNNQAQPFGGITAVFGGDFQQVLPVIPKGTPEQIVRACLHKSGLWINTTVFHLTQNMRLQNNANPAVAEFAQWLLDVGHNRLPFVNGVQNQIAIPPDMKIPGDNSLLSLLLDIY